jgi:hypothetical protein
MLVRVEKQQLLQRDSLIERQGALQSDGFAQHRGAIAPRPPIVYQVTENA